MADEVLLFLNHHSHVDESNITLIFAVYLEVKDIASYAQHLPQGGDHKLLLSRYYEWFVPAVNSWLILSGKKAIRRVSIKY